MLCLPINGDDGIIGVIELFDKHTGKTFTADDMGTLGMFGEAAAVAIGQAQVLNDLTRLFAALLDRLLSATPDAALLQDARRRWSPVCVGASDYRDAIQIALTDRADCPARPRGQALLLAGTRGLCPVPARAAQSCHARRAAVMKPAWHEPSALALAGRSAPWEAQ